MEPAQSTNRPHIMVVGGTGMLAGVCRSLGDRGHRVSVLARRPRDLGPGVVCFACDYTDAGTFKDAILRARRTLGRPAVLITWIHGTAPEGARLAAELAAPDRHLDIVGSRCAHTPAPGPSGAGGERIVLGFVMESGGSRWLTHAEICTGVLGALDHPRALTVVGVVEPWDRRPG